MQRCARLLLNHAQIATKSDPLGRFAGVVYFSTTSRKMPSEKHQVAKRLIGTENNVWIEFTELTRVNNALNLGQGLPDYACPQYVKDGLVDAVNGGNELLNQYTRGFGHPRLVNALAKTHGKVLGKELNPMTDILVTSGAYESLYCSVQGYVNPGDEVIIIEPYFDCYEPMVRKAGGTPVFIPLRPIRPGATSSAEYQLDPAELASKFSSKTRAIIVNNPNNPLGKVFKKEELQVIADLCIKHDVLAFADEVYEWMIFPGSEMVKLATLPGMWERTLSISSAGKTFSVTGWKLGWTIGPADLVKPLMYVHQNCVYTCPTPIQEAVARGFELEDPRMDKPESYFRSLANDELLPKRDKMAAALKDIGMIPIVPEGGYFMIADFSNIDFPFDSSSPETKDYQFVKWMIKNKKLGSIPPSAFYSKEHKNLATNLVRFCFFKKDETLNKAADIIHGIKSGQ